MYILTPTSAVWQDDEASSSPPPMRPAVKTLWALHPLQLPHGRCVAVRMRGEHVLQVCLQTRDGKRWWKPVESVLTPILAQRWARQGF